MLTLIITSQGEVVSVTIIEQREKMFFLLLFQLGTALRPCGTLWNEYMIGDEAMCMKDSRVEVLKKG